MTEPPNRDREPTDAELRALYERATRGAPGASAPAVTPEALRDLVEGAGSEAARLATLDRVMSDPRLRREFDLLGATAAAARGIDPGAPVARRRMRTPALRWSLAAAGLLVAATVGGLWRSARDHMGDAADRMRGASADAPAAGVSLVQAALPTAGGALGLTWHAVDGATRYDVEVLAPDGSARSSESTSDTTLTLSAARAASVRTGDRWWVRARLANGLTVRSPIAPLGAPGDRP